MISLALPFPPSQNHFYRHAKGRVYKSEDGKKYQSAVKALAQRAESPMLTGKIDVTLHLFRPANRGDIDNYAKLLLDSLQGTFYRNDSQIVRLLMIKGDDKRNPRVEITIKAAS